ncbi:MAG: UDP-N-acetylmuramoyl-L-alanine--D-glutamate ligase, partial [Oscillospiraceae bacterium]|nr:UDP-N-acetylmuramoyl-L-alanine--D-glutamate ligase [Oscillospiraceae bacterium]
MTVADYLSSLRGKRVCVVGIGVSNTPLLEMLLNAGIEVTACDKRSSEAQGEKARRLEALGALLKLGDGYLENLEADVIFRTPGLRPDVPELERAKRRGARITSEMEAFFQVCPCPIVAVTGSDGKTTTTTLIAEMLRTAGRRVHVGGNIGRPLLPDAAGMKPGNIAVLELSSFQLMTMGQSPDVAVVTNVAPNHLDVHKSMEEYIAAKENILAAQTPQGLAVLNGDNEITRGFADRARGQVILFSRKQPLPDGVDIENGVICLRGKPVLLVEDILLPGVHNVENYMAAVGAVGHLVDAAVIRQVASSFAGVEHRIELVRTLRGVRYYNDSIASSPTRTIAGLRSFEQKVILIAGGYDKKIPFDELGVEIVSHVKVLSLSGATADKIRAAVESAPGCRPGQPEILQSGSFEQAVLAAHRAARPGDVVLLGPACASGDRWLKLWVRGG